MSRGMVAAAGVILGLAVVLAHAPGASAHESLADSSPRPGEVLESGPSEIDLIFSGQLLEGGAAVAVSDSDSHDWVVRAPAVEDSAVSVELDQVLPDGEYEVLWRVVSSDGHPISGAFTFQVGEGGSTVPAPRATDPAGSDHPAELAASAVWVVPLAILAVAAVSVYMWRRAASRKLHE